MIEISTFPKTNAEIPIAICLTSCKNAPAMPKSITFRPAEKDRHIIDKLADKLGIKTSQVIKIALRRLAEAEGLRLKAS